ncbi:hypothetical protein DM01DRAFT_1344880 [Hesseltinella vesiculosa]|uniref:Uncharacterized protein n=1 Tax=Hesseltinella vesiculosa TaxID=101127 RepID=A0A1X2GKX5_9FUNG|nr:hypothetical protein DM01DRAFT_1344880 [Hesseltinella vesiculosa]
MLFMQFIFTLWALVAIAWPWSGADAAPAAEFDRVSLQRRSTSHSTKGEDVYSQQYETSMMYMTSISQDINEFTANLQMLTQNLRQDDDALSKVSVMVTSALQLAGQLYQPESAPMILPDLAGTVQNIFNLVVEQNDDPGMRNFLRVISDGLVQLSIDLRVPIDLRGISSALNDQQEP